MEIKKKKFVNILKKGCGNIEKISENFEKKSENFKN